MKIIKRILLTLFILLGLFWIYSSSLIGVNEQAKIYLQTLDKTVKAEGYQSNYYVISGRRWKPDNYLLNKFGGASSKSKHLKGQAIDILVLDVNGDGKRNFKDVDIIYKILDKKIIQNKGGLGSYKNTNGFFSRQMIHFDCRGKRARWNR